MNEYRNDVRESAELPILPRAPILAIQANQTDSRYALPRLTRHRRLLPDAGTLSERLRHDLDLVDDPAGEPSVGERVKPASLNGEAVMADPVSPIGYQVAIRSGLPELRALYNPVRVMAAQTSSILDAPGTLIRLSGNMHPIHRGYDNFERFGDSLTIGQIRP